ncbi:MAG: type II secretion system GspH family protein [Proteobacteria bacterium]|nr:type II secretion system GspH family protein [Pseudomonadota bacterium]
MRKRKSNEKGFTLIEVIVTLVLVGIMAALAGMWIVSVVNGYIFTKMNADTVQKAQLAMTRLTMEFTRIKTVDATTAGPDTQINYTRTGPSGTPISGIVKIDRASKLLQLQLFDDKGTALTPLATLTDAVDSFTLAYCNDVTTACQMGWLPGSKIIEITLTLMGANNTTSAFTKRVTPRYL